MPKVYHKGATCFSYKLFVFTHSSLFMSALPLIWNSIVHFHLELEELQSHIKSGKVYQYLRPKETIEMYKDGGIAIIDQWIAAHGRLAFFVQVHYFRGRVFLIENFDEGNGRNSAFTGGMVNWTKLGG